MSESAAVLVGPRVGGESWARRWMVPSLADLFFLALVVWMLVFTNAGAPNGLLQDAATGFHIRTGEQMLDTGSFPYQDTFSFSKPDGAWYAWEWLADIVFALLFRAFGLKGVILLGAFTLAGSCWVVFRHMAWRGANALASLFVLHAVVAAGSVHFLARPHAFTLLFLAISFFLLDRDRRWGDRKIWWLVPLSALWVNLHGGFVGLLISVGILAVGAVMEREFGRARRYAALGGACFAATLANPYGFALYGHLVDYLRAGWIRKIVMEFQAPPLETPAGMYFEALLFAGIAVAAYLIRERKWGEALLIAAWAHAALLSIRHVPIFAVVAAPALAVTLTGWMDEWAAAAGRGSVARILKSIGEEHAAGLRRSSLLIPALAVLLFAGDWGLRYPTDFPAAKYPLEAIAKHNEVLRTTRLFTLDAWGDYLVYRNYPGQRVFFDGRTDYYGAARSEEYLTLVNGTPGWKQLLDRYQIETVMLAEAAPLVEFLKESPGWRRLDQLDGVVILTRR